MAADDTSYPVIAADDLFNILPLHPQASGQPGKESFWQRSDGRDNDAIEAFNYVLLMAPTPFNGQEYDNFLESVASKMADSPFNIPRENITKIDGTYASYLHDAVLGYAITLDEMLQQGGNPRDGRLFRQILPTVSFTGLTGHVTFDNNGDRRQDYSLYDFRDSREFLSVGIYDAHLRTYVPSSEAEIQWGNSENTPPADAPKCGFDGALCVYRDEALYISGITVGAMLGCVLVLSPFLLSYIIKVRRKRKFEKELMTFNWKINYSDIHQNRRGKSLGSVYSGISDITSDEDGRSICTTITSSSTFSGKRVQIFTTRGTYKGQIVALKMINKKNIVLNREQLLELRMMKEFQHDNLCRFIGVCIDAPNICIVSEYCAKGSLQDILENEDIKLDRVFKMSFAADILNGLHFLHNKTPIGFHGNFKSSDCLVDNRWVVKISDYGLRLFKDGQEYEHSEHAHYKKLLWRAPELLREPNSSVIGYKKGDIYSLGIIFQEIALRDEPYCMFPDLSPKGKKSKGM
ncbi:atrial natriuretic peptide receptor 1-like, partial [Saccoglossus kowalevskii]